MRDEESSPYPSSRAITSAPLHSAQPLPESSSPQTSSQAPEISQRSRTRRHLALGEQFNAPLRPHTWTAKKQWTRALLDKERQEFFDTRVTGHPEIWATLKVILGLLADGDVPTAQSILDAAAITVPTGDLKNGAYDEAGNLYHLPEHIISDPQNLLTDRQEEIQKGETSDEMVEDDELERKREKKGKEVLKIGDIVKIRARLSDRGGPDVVIQMGKDQAVRTLIRRIQEEANVRIKGGI